jgi:hypothetical protein
MINILFNFFGKIMLNWSDVAAALYGISGTASASTPDNGTIISNINILNGSNSTPGSIAYTQALVDPLVTLMDNLKRLEANVDTSTLANNVNSVSTYLTALGNYEVGNGYGGGSFLDVVNGALGAFRGIYNSYVDAYNNYNSPTGVLYESLTTLENGVSDLASYTGAITPSSPSSASGSTLTQATGFVVARDTEFNQVVGFFGDLFGFS